MQILAGLIRTMRPRQWTKSILFVFPPLIFDKQLLNPESFLRVCVTAVLLILLSGAVYILNDLVDVESDRQHPRKKHRPIPAGLLSARVAALAVILMVALTLALSFIFSRILTVILVMYLGLQIAYSFYLKHIVVLDVMTVSVGFLLRIAAGAVVIQAESFSPWLYVAGGLLALFLVIGKRRQDLLLLGNEAVNSRRIYEEYNLPLLDDMLRMVTTALVIIYIIYTIEAPTIKISNTNLSLLTVPIVIYGLLRYLYLIHTRGDGSAPDEVLLQDRPLQVAVALWGGVFIVLLYFFNSG